MAGAGNAPGRDRGLAALEVGTTSPLTGEVAKLGPQVLAQLGGGVQHYRYRAVPPPPWLRYVAALRAALPSRKGEGRRLPSSRPLGADGSELERYFRNLQHLQCSHRLALDPLEQQFTHLQPGERDV